METAGAVEVSAEIASSTAQNVDRFYVGVVLMADVALLLLAYTTSKKAGPDTKVPPKGISSALLFAGLSIAVLHPLEDRYFTLMIPLALFFEPELHALTKRIRRRG